MKKVNRVTDNRDFGKIIEAGLSKTSRSFVISILKNELGYTRVGVSVSKKRGNAVKRNLIKRQVRAMCQQNLNFNESHDLIIIVRAGYNPMCYAEMEVELKELINHLQRSYYGS